MGHALMQGPPLKLQLAGYDVRPATAAEMDACNALCRRVHGFDRGAELGDAIVQKSARLVQHLGRITGYATDIGFFAHPVGASNEDLKALIGAAPAFTGPAAILILAFGGFLGCCAL